MDAFKDYINKNNITNRTDLISLSWETYIKAKELYPDYLDENFPLCFYKWSEIIKTQEDLVNFIKDKNITSISELSIKWHGLSNHIINIIKKSEWLRSVFDKSDFGSLWERRFSNELSDREYDYTIQHRITKSGLKLDFYLEQKNIGIEIQGPSHTNWKTPRYNRESFIDQRKRDLKKRRECKKQGIRLLYFTYDSSLVIDWDKGYFDYVYTNIEELFKDINETH